MLHSGEQSTQGPQTVKYGKSVTGRVSYWEVLGRKDKWCRLGGSGVLCCWGQVAV